MIYRFRVILDDQEDVFRDIEIEANATLEDLHNVITQSFGFGGQEMASFYLSNQDWEQGDEFPLFEMNDEMEGSQTMSETVLRDILDEDQTHMIYIYDFLNMWTFLVELADIGEYEEGKAYPNLMFAHGQLPEEAPDKEFIGEDFDEGDLDLDDDDLDLDDYDSLDFDENWN